MKGIELLRLANNSTNNLALPPKFLIFCQNFKLGRDALKIEYVNIDGDLIQLNSINYYANNYENALSYFLDIPNLIVEKESYESSLYEYNLDGFIKIGLFDVNDSLLLKIKGSDEDSIWKWSGDWGDERPQYERIASDIFDFVEKLESVVIQINLLVRNVLLEQLYKNWGEDFWRVRQDKEVA